jgi:ketosteroid isomerase-like protein
MWDTWKAMFAEFRAEADEYVDAGDCIIAPGRLSGRSRDSGLTIREPYTWVFTWRNGKALEVRDYRTKAEPLEARRLRD